MTLTIHARLIGRRTYVQARFAVETLVEASGHPIGILAQSEHKRSAENTDIGCVK